MDNVSNDFNIKRNRNDLIAQPPSIFLNMPVRDSKNRLSPKQVILSLLRAKTMKQVDLADKIGISRQALNHYISGRWAVPTQIKVKIAQALEVDSAVIWDLEDKK